ncbi:hypothetical protein AZE42_09197 [Rhizopogon vesiculosus]|uniref:Uncharacterized protein n=1 Tax=Rhizopogon vesiculosus TaxID=180088 RepID=A0A1J8Q9U4_9AGAM|nr:hypothetical protein AZE42_09197 [Rhizopogon vesiculosus]
MRASHGEAQRGGVLSLPSSSSSAATPPCSCEPATAEAPSVGAAVSYGKGEVVEIIGSAQYYNAIRLR